MQVIGPSDPRRPRGMPCSVSIDLSLNFFSHENIACETTAPSPPRKMSLRLALCAVVVLSLQACAVIAVADAAVTLVATGVKVTVKAVGAVASAAIAGDD